MIRMVGRPMHFTYLTISVSGSNLKHPNEDSVAFNSHHHSVAWADGITRVSDRLGSYPSPSPSAAAARAFTAAALAALNQNETLIDACGRGNSAIRQLWPPYQKSWGGFDYSVHDYPDCVGGVARLQAALISYCVLSDCGLAIINSAHQISFQTEDRIQKVRRHPDWPAITGPSDIQGRQKCQRDWRNRPAAEHPTYGAFTGEDFALINSDENGQKKYLITGSYHLRPGDTAICYTDGIIPFLADQQFLLLASKANEQEIASYLAENPLGTAADDRSCVIIRVN